MDSATQDLYNIKISELVYDEEKIITCNSIAAELGISMVDAKFLLNEYYKDHEDFKPGELHVTYLISGILISDNSLAVYLVKDEDLVEKQSLFGKLSSKVLYSIQKGADIDLNCVSLVNNSIENSSVLGMVCGKNCVQRDIKVKKIPVPPPKEVKKEPTSVFKPQPKVESQASKPKPAAKSNGIASFLTQGSGTSNVKKEIVPKKEEVKKEPEIIEEQMEVDVEEPKEEPKQEKQTKNKKRKSTKADGEKPNKKRKRIQEVCDSDSDIFDEEEENEDVIDNTDEELPEVKPKSPLQKRVRKAVDKTFEDEDGFLVTTTEYIYESVPDTEVKPEPVIPNKPKTDVVLKEKKNSTTDSEAEVKGTAKGKKGKKPISANQPSIMSFFKKK